MEVYLILTEPTQATTPVKPMKHVIVFPQRPHMVRSTQSLKENLMMFSTWLWSAVVKKSILENVEKV